MNPNQLEHDKDTIVIDNPERVLFDGWQIGDASISTTPVGNLPTPLQSLEAALQEVTVPSKGVVREENFDGLTDRSLSKERSASTI